MTMVRTGSVDTDLRTPDGWIRNVRLALGMSGVDLARRMGISPSRVSQLERAEPTGEIKVTTLERAADAMGCDVVYVFVPRPGSAADEVRSPALDGLDHVADAVAGLARRAPG